MSNTKKGPTTATSTGPQTLEKIWDGDLFDRSQDAAFLQRFLMDQSQLVDAQKKRKAYVLNLDASWGRGKTFFLKRFADQVKQDQHLTVTVNAWRDDFADDPLLAVMSAIDEVLQPHLKSNSKAQKAWSAAKKETGAIAKEAAIGGGKRLVAFLIGNQAVDGITGLISDGMAENEQEDNGTTRDTSKKPTTDSATRAVGEDVSKAVGKSIDRLSTQTGTQMLNDFQSKRNSIKKFAENVSEVLRQLEQAGTIKSPMFVFVDELDRCRPPYAIAMLERIKHLFEVPDLVFVVATDSKQLSHSVKAVYGVDFDSRKYLKRFFNRTYEFEKPDTEKFIRSCFDSMGVLEEKISTPLDNTISLLAKGCDWAGLELRDIEQVVASIAAITRLWEPNVRLQSMLLFPYVILNHMGIDITKAETFVKELKERGRGGWTFQIHAHTRSPGSDSVSVIDQLATYRKYMGMQLTKMLFELEQKANGMDFLQYLAVNIREEMYERKARDVEVYSYMNEYHRLVLQAGRLQ
ncbi:P-loop NTPase fold protein [Fulvimarina sp. 2208YS6-2-32]|uniref:P-loop NTPase fold protein n=1 Tax=Fulvimarina uroteuthidis TaxID=3098149 RepID=A0ABU5I167_9HYPH|nr:P-loop NTPase fold protein [Fulvimarina sp. 2208YS6-2-32]MDY8109125.1 P-loop NTPase fold protein [Fulvimarina sp. 2208YS6-2-32]